jgi:hypothetical protein
MGRSEGGAHWQNWRYTVLVRDVNGDVQRTFKTRTLGEIDEELESLEVSSVDVRDERTGRDFQRRAKGN